jgi:hypothetical protein
VTRFRPTFVLILLTVLVAGCSGDDDSGGSGDGGATTVAPALAGGNGNVAVDVPDPCEVLGTDEIAAVLDPSAREPVTIEERQFRTLAECGYTVSNTFVGASHINVRIEPAVDSLGDRLEDARVLAEAEFEVEDVSGLGDEAFWYYDGVLGPQLWVRVGDLALTLGFTGFDPDVGMDRDTQESLGQRFVDALN